MTLWSGSICAELRDPTQPLAVVLQDKAKAEIEQKEKLVLKSILFNQKPSAIINHDHVYVGDTIQGMTVDAIQSNQVVLKNQSGARTQLFLFSSIKSNHRYDNRMSGVNHEK